MGELKIDNISKAYPVRRGWNATSTVQIFENLSFTIQDGEFVSLIGPSGCGKTTVLNLAAGLDTLSAGCISVDGVKIRGPGLNRGVVFQDFALFPWLTVAENIAFGLKSQGLPRSEREARVATTSTWSVWPAIQSTIPTGCRVACASVWVSDARSQSSPPSF